MPVWEKHVVCSSSANKVLLKPSCGTHSINRQSSGISGVDSGRLGNIRRCPASSWFSHVLGGWKQKRHENPNRLWFTFQEKGQMFGENMILMFGKVCVCVWNCVFSKYPIYFPLRFYAKTGEEYQMGGSHTIFLWDLYASSRIEPSITKSSALIPAQRRIRLNTTTCWSRFRALKLQLLHTLSNHGACLKPGIWVFPKIVVPPNHPF